MFVPVVTTVFLSMSLLVDVFHLYALSSLADLYLVFYTVKLLALRSLRQAFKKQENFNERGRFSDI